MVSSCCSSSAALLRPFPPKSIPVAMSPPIIILLGTTPTSPPLSPFCTSGELDEILALCTTLLIPWRGAVDGGGEGTPTEGQRGGGGGHRVKRSSCMGDSVKGKACARGCVAGARLAGWRQSWLAPDPLARGGAMAAERGRRQRGSEEEEEDTG
eukprot:CAMPEP_0167819560 /NCGR_PEP_ID=MMETSP0112_2-20121227/5473_1 /TAXON_ID=91324 /ORGANISM="Lotharella globosa, Strain CCCM811" /LENGTH=153 /DNA_ID=CAMNT_0007719759 /DNA_START=1081 /DNA_END=1543 /DNA_ORIENTATION=+